MSENYVTVSLIQK